jgi:hypothetical protein
MTAAAAAEAARESDLAAALGILTAAASPLSMIEIAWDVAGPPVPDGRTRACKCWRGRVWAIWVWLLEEWDAGRLRYADTPDRPYPWGLVLAGAAGDGAR